MTRILVLLAAFLFFKAVLPRRPRYSPTAPKPYGSALDMAVPHEIACSVLCDPELLARVQDRTPSLLISDRR